MRTTFTLCLAIVVTASCGSFAIAQNPVPQSPPSQYSGAPPAESTPGLQQAPAPVVVAKVNDKHITQRELAMSMQRHVSSNPQLAANIQTDQRAAAELQKQVLETLIDGALVEQYMIEQGPAVDDTEIDAAVDQIKNQVQAQGAPFDEFLQQRGQTEEGIKNQLQGIIAWQKFQQENVTEPRLQAFYQQNQHHFGEQDYAQVRDQVAQAYTNGLWTQIVEKARPEAEIEVMGQYSGQQPGAQPNRAQDENRGAPAGSTQSPTFPAQ